VLGACGLLLGRDHRDVAGLGAAAWPATTAMQLWAVAIVRLAEGWVVILNKGSLLLFLPPKRLEPCWCLEFNAFTSASWCWPPKAEPAQARVSVGSSKSVPA
jgi:hypothetical protein